MDERAACSMLRLQPGATASEIDDAWKRSDKSRAATRAAQLLRELLRATTVISRTPTVQCWADEEDD